MQQTVEPETGESDGAVASGWSTGCAGDLGRATLPRHWYARSTIDILEEVAAAHPDRILIDDGVDRLSNGQVLHAVRHLARAIVAATPDDRPIALLLRADVSFAVLWLAGSASGRMMVMLELGAPRERNEPLIRASGASAIVTVADPAIDLSCVPAGLPVLRAVAPPPEPIALPDRLRGLDAGYAIGYTSGSTGDPKGAVYSERAVLHVSLMFAEQQALGPSDVILCMASVSTFGVRDLLCALASGARLRLFDMRAGGINGLLRVMQQEGVTKLGFIPSAMRAIAQIPGIANALARLRMLELGGEPTSIDDIALLRTVLARDCRIQLFFGSSEVGMICLWDVPDPLTETVLPIGVLAPGRTIALLDQAGGFVGETGVGELHVSDGHMPLGYWRDGRIDDARFRAAPGDPGPRSHATGDLLRRRGDGLYDFIGRCDRMVKVRGLQVDLTEVERSARSIIGVADAAAVTFERAGDSLGVALFVTAMPETGAPDAGAIRAAITTLGAHMVPHRIVTLDALPRLYNGKPDLVALAGSVDARR